MDPAYLLSRPEFDLSPEKQARFEKLWRSTPSGDPVDYRLQDPKWQYLSWLCESKELVLHGSQVADINLVEPRQAHDIRAYSNQKAIYATTDGIWVIFFAILDRNGNPGLSLWNSCLRARVPGEQFSDPLYFFSITQSVKKQNPWCEGMVYILPRQGFTQESSQSFMGIDVVFPHWISNTAVTPVSKIAVLPQDFPFLSQIHGHNDEKLVELYTMNPGVFPREALES